MTRATTPRIRRVNRGDRLSAAQWNAVRDAVLSILREQQGLGLPLTSHLPVPAVLMRLKTSNGDYYTCRRFDGTTEGDSNEYVAKPFELRPSVTSLGSQTYVYTSDVERTATDGGDNETQVIVPPWYLNETLLWVARARFTGVTGPAGEELRWIDLNLGARAWAKKAGT